MDDPSQKTSPADRFNQTINDPAVRAAINLQAAVLYSRCSGLLGRAPPAQLLPHPAPSHLLSSQLKYLRRAPDQLPHPSPSQTSTQSKYLRKAPDQLPPTPVHWQLTSQSSWTPALLPPSPSQLSSQPRYLTRENQKNRMDNSRERSRPRRTKKPIYRLQVGSKKQQTKVYTETQFQHHQKGNRSKLSLELSQVSNKLLKNHLEQQESVCPARSKREKLETNHADDENNARKADPSMMTYVPDVLNKDGDIDLSETEGDTDIQATTFLNSLSLAGGDEGTYQVNNNESKSIKKYVDQSREMPKDHSERAEFNENVVRVDRQTKVANGSNQLDIDTLDTEPLVLELGEKNNNLPLVTTAAVESGEENENYRYISRWVPFLRKRKLCLEGDLLNLDEEPNSMCASRYFTSRLLERHSDRRVATKNSLYALEGPLLIPDPTTRPMPIFVIEKFKNGFPEDWKNVVDIWASFTDHRVIQSSASQFDLARFSLCSSEIGFKAVNICAMTDGSLIENMAAVNGGNFVMKRVPPQCFSPDI